MEGRGKLAKTIVKQVPKEWKSWDNMEFEVSIMHSQGFSNNPYPDPNQSNSSY